MTKTKCIVITCIVTFISSQLHAMVFDNRYFPLIKKPFLYVPNRLSHFRAMPFFVTGSKAVGNVDDEIGIPEINGKFDLNKLSNAISLLKCPNPLSPEFRLVSFPYVMEGVLQGQGVLFEYEQYIFNHVSLGLDFFFMRLNSRQDFLLQSAPSVPIAPEELDEDRRLMFQELGFCNANTTQFGLSDINVYARLWHTWFYTLKFRRIDVGLRVGALIPTGLTHKINVPASIPYGGNGHWGMYVGVDAEFEVKEDISAGMLLQYNQRFKRTSLQRIPIAGEPEIFGAVVGPVTVKPGGTLIFRPYCTLEALRAGMGFRFIYTLIKHWNDCWLDERCIKTPPATLFEINNLSSWKSDYVTISVFYDFGKVKAERCFAPIIVFEWDIPALFFSSQHSAKTNKISLGVEFNF